MVIFFKSVMKVCWLLVRARIPSWILRWKFRNDLNEEFPKGRAVPSDQGIYQTCTRHALGKAIADRFQNKIFDSRAIDFDQDGPRQRDGSELNFILQTVRIQDLQNIKLMDM